MVDETGGIATPDHSSEDGVEQGGQLSRRPSRDLLSDSDSITNLLLFTPQALTFPSPQTFKFTRTAPWLQRFRPKLMDFDDNPVHARWKFACAAVKYEATRKSNLWHFYQTRFAERRRVVDLTLRFNMWIKGFTIAPEDALSNADREEISHFRNILDPGDARFYSALADIEMQKLPWHMCVECFVLSVLALMLPNTADTSAMHARES